MLGFSEYCTLIEYYFKYKVKDLDEYAQYVQKLKWLMHIDVIDKKITNG